MTIDFQAFFILLSFLGIVWFFYKWAKQYDEPSLLFPDLAPFNAKKKPSFKQKYAFLPKVCLWTAFTALALSFIDPHYFALKDGAVDNSQKFEGIAIYLIADESGSMMEEVNARGDTGSVAKMTKIDLLKKVTFPFIKNRPDDLIGLVSFARTADVRAPLTLDHQTVIDEILALAPSINEEQGGTAIGFAVFKTVNLIVATKHFANDLIKEGKPAYEIKNAIIVLVTDGVQNVNPRDINDKFRSMDVSEAALYAKENNVRFYAINIDPSILTSKFKPERNLMQRVTESTGGHFYVIDNSTSLSHIYDEINKIEKSEIKNIPLSKAEQPELYQRVSFFPYLLEIALSFLFLYVLMETFYFKRVP